MKSIKFIITILCCLCCSLLSAQTTYKNVTIDRDRKNVNQVVVTNENNYPVQVKFRYMVGSKNAEWKEYIDYNGSYANDYIEVDAKRSKTINLGNKIYGLNLTYVDILQPSVGEKILEGVGLFMSGVEEGKRQNTNNQ